MPGHIRGPAWPGAARRTRPHALDKRRRTSKIYAREDTINGRASRALIIRPRLIWISPGTAAFGARVAMFSEEPMLSWGSSAENRKISKVKERFDGDDGYCCYRSAGAGIGDP